MIEPGARIGILGGGQLGRMLSMAAAELGYRCHIYAPESESIAAEVSAEFTSAPWHTEGALTAFARKCDVITYEFENVPVGPLAAIPAEKLAPGPLALEVAQDRLAEKRFAQELGGQPAPYAPVDTKDDLLAAFGRFGPGILKTRREGYDGKGQWRLSSRAEAEALDLPNRGLVYEGLVAFEAEFSVILVAGMGKSASGIARITPMKAAFSPALSCLHLRSSPNRWVKRASSPQRWLKSSAILAC